MKAKELREKNIDELENELRENQDAVRELRFEIVMKQAKDHRDIRNAKRNIARINTVINEKENN